MNQKGFVKDVVIVILALVVAGGVYIGYSKGLINFGSKDETSDWKTYTNENRGFELKYPDFFSDLYSSGLIMQSPNKSDGISLAFFNKPLDGFQYTDQASSNSYTYNLNEDKWIPKHIGSEEFAPIKYSSRNDLKIYVVAGGDAAWGYRIAFVESPDKTFVAQLEVSRTDGWIDCVNPCPEEKPFGDDNTIYKILDSIKIKK